MYEAYLQVSSDVNPLDAPIIVPDPSGVLEANSELYVCVSVHCIIKEEIPPFALYQKETVIFLPLRLLEE